MINLRIYSSVFLFYFFSLLQAQEESLTLSLAETVEMAQKSSPDAIAARHSFRASYWNYKFFRANYLPSLTLTSNPQLNREINKVTQPDGTEVFVRQNQLNTDLTLKVNQNVWFTGGSLFIKSAMQRMDIFDDRSTAYSTSPIVVGYEQELLGYNSLKWDRRIEPVRYREAKKKYAETMELVAVEAGNKFFDLATAQTNLDIAIFNYANADTLYRYAKGRYNIGTITENEMLQLEINKLTEETNMMNARIETDNQVQILRAYLGVKAKVTIKVKVEDEIPAFTIELEKAMQEANRNNPEKEYVLRRKLESESNIASAKGNAGLKADLYLQFGLSQTADKIAASYRNPLSQQYVSVGIALPILDWGRARGQVKVAQSNRDMVYTQMEQEETNFEMNVRKMVKQFNLQSYKVSIAGKTDATAQRRNEVVRKLYLLGKSTILDLNASITEKDKARRDYILSLSSYWSLFYGLRSLTLYDFQRDIPITEDYTSLLK